MNIALCLHGLFNSLTDPTSNGVNGYRYIKKHILDKGNVDIFIHSWKIDNSIQDFIQNLYNPIISVFETPKTFDEIITLRKLDTIKNCPRKPHSVISHLYSVSEVLKLPYKINKNYDIIIKSRFDLGQINRNTSGPGKHNKYPVQCINLINEIKENYIYMANWEYFNMGPPDMWFYGDANIMKNFINLFDFLNLNLFIDSDYHKFATSIEGNYGDICNAIAIYKYWMLSNGLWDKKITLNTIWE